ncbi:MAG: hypothetical protein LBT70_00810 [Holosporaceae bacterium]|jgi:hypothetical protein|nr:hypothetical protein [Holosporaceae bacterium]
MANLGKKIMIIVLASFLGGISASALNILIPKAAEVEEIQRIMNELEADLADAILKNKIKDLSQNHCCHHRETILKSEGAKSLCCCHEAVLLAQEKKIVEHKMELLDKFKVNNRSIIEILAAQVASGSNCCGNSEISEETSQNLDCPIKEELGKSGFNRGKQPIISGEKQGKFQ